MSWIFPLSGSGLCSMQLCVCGGGRIAFHIWRKQMCAFLELALRFRAVIVSVSTSEKTHASTHLSLFCFFALNPLRWVWDLSEVLRRVQIIFFFFFFSSNHGGHRGSRLEPATPVGPALYSSDQRVRHLTERLAAYCWSGKKWPEEESSLRRAKLFLCCCFRLMRTQVEARCVLFLFDLIWQR